jgi:hypothetical protein
MIFLISSNVYYTFPKLVLFNLNNIIGKQQILKFGFEFSVSSSHFLLSCVFMRKCTECRDKPKMVWVEETSYDGFVKNNESLPWCAIPTFGWRE